MKEETKRSRLTLTYVGQSGYPYPKYNALLTYTFVHPETGVKYEWQTRSYPRLVVGVTYNLTAETSEGSRFIHLEKVRGLTSDMLPKPQKVKLELLFLGMKGPYRTKEFYAEFICRTTGRRYRWYSVEEKFFSGSTPYLMVGGVTDEGEYFRLHRPKFTSKP